MSNTRKKFEERFKVVGEIVHLASYYEVEENSGEIAVIDIDDWMHSVRNSYSYQNDHFYIAEVGEDGKYIIPDNYFTDYKSAWKEYRKLKRKYENEKSR